MGRHPEEAPTELMTEAEHKVMDLLGQIWNELVTNVVADEGGRNVDTKELMFHIHCLQRAVMAQAACRAYPGQYRLLGADALGKKKES